MLTNEEITRKYNEVAFIYDLAGAIVEWTVSKKRKEIADMANGRILLLEHGASTNRTIHWIQKRLAPRQ